MKTLGAVVAVCLWLSVHTSVEAGSGTWQDLAPMPAARQELATAVLDGKIYVLGGYDVNGLSTDSVFVYNPNTNAWTSAHVLPAVNNHSNAAVAAGKLYSFGGMSNATYVYDPVGDSWTRVADSNFAHSSTAAVGVINDKIYVAGGAGAGNAAEVFDPQTNTWTVLASMSVPRNHCGGGVIDGKLYVVGGRDSAHAPTALEAYDPVTNTWTTLPSMPTGRSGIGVAVVHGELYVFGGELPVLHPEVEVYNPTTNSWRQWPNMSTPRHGIWASVIGNRIYLAGGGIDQGLAASEINDVFIVNSVATFANISTRLHVQTGDNALIGGFIVSGTGSKRILSRATGPSLPVSGALADPRLELYDSAGLLLVSNDNWQDAPNQQSIVDTNIAPSNSTEAAILTTLTPGGYTAIVRGAGESTGTALVEAYDLETGSDSTLANISTRGFVQTQNDVLIGGLILTGQEERRVIVRAIGPSLNISGVLLSDPTLELRNADGAVLASNDNWRSTQEAEIIATTIAPLNDLESAIVQTLLPGSYTAIARGVGDTTGIGVVEAYALQ